MSSHKHLVNTSPKMIEAWVQASIVPTKICFQYQSFKARCSLEGLRLRHLAEAVVWQSYQGNDKVLGVS